MATTLGQANPFRYRGYYFDTESRFYYLQSRYYDPVIGRFLNADGLVAGVGNVQGYNLFQYAMNNPVNMSDPSGYCPFWNGFSDFFVGQWDTVKSIYYDPVGSYIGYVSDPWNWFPAARLMRDQALEVSGIWQSAISGDIDGLSYAFGQRAGMATEVLAVAGVSKGVKSAIKPKTNPGKPFKSGQKVGDCQIGVDPNTLKLNTNILPGKYNAALAKCKNGIYGSIEVWSDGTVYNGNHRVSIARNYGWAVDVEVRLK